MEPVPKCPFHGPTHPKLKIEEYHPDVEIEKYSIQADHVHLIIVIPPKYSVSAIVGKIKANTSREVRKRFPWVRC
jgi:putative transposase